MPVVLTVPAPIFKPWDERVVNDVGDLIVELPEAHTLFTIDCEVISQRTILNVDTVLAGKSWRGILVNLSMWWDGQPGYENEEALIRERVAALQESAETDRKPTLLVDAVDRRRKILYVVVPDSA